MSQRSVREPALGALAQLHIVREPALDGVSTPGGGRTRAGPGLSRLPLPLGYGGDSIVPRRSLGVVEESLAGLATEVALLDELSLYLWRVTALALAVPILHRPIKDDEAAEIEQVEGPHRPVEAFLHRDVDVLSAGVPAFEQVHRFLGRGKEDAVDDEAPDLLVQHDGYPIDAAHEFGRRSDGGVGGRWALHHLAKLHDRDRVEEMHVAAPIWIGCELGQTADGDGAAVAGEDRVLLR